MAHPVLPFSPAAPSAVCLLTAVFWLVTAPSPAAAPDPAAPTPATNTLAAEPPDAKQPPPLDPRLFQTQPGLRIEVVATEPLVYAPSAMAFDADGRLFVTEMRDYPDQRDQTPHLGRVRVLEDTDGDGTFDSATVFADNLAWPSAIACFNGGVYVAATPQVIYLKDTEGHGTANVHTVIFNNFGGTNAPDRERLLANFTWGPDLRIHALTAGLAGEITTPAAPDNGTFDLYAQDVSFDPRTLQLAPEPGPARSGLSFDFRGRKWVSDERRPLRVAMRSARYYARNPTYAPAQDFVDALSPATAIFPLLSSTATNEVASLSPTNAPGSNRLSTAWIKNARGLHIYQGTALPPTYRGTAFIADELAGIVFRAHLRDAGLAAVAARGTNESRTEFLRSRDPEFRPRHLTTGPDGALYIADMRVGGNAGRIYRVVPVGFKQPAPARLSKQPARELAGLLADTNSWQRETAARLLWENQDPSARSLLTNMLHNARAGQTRYAAACVLTAIGYSQEPWIGRALRDPDDRVREQGLRAVERSLRDGNISDALWSQVQPMANDPSIHVRRQLAWTLGSIRRDERNPMLATLVRRDPENIWVQDAVLSSLNEYTGPFFTLLASEASFRNTPAGEAFLYNVATMVGAAGEGNGVAAVIDWAASMPPRTVMGLVAALGEGFRRNGTSLAAVDAARRLQPVYLEALDAIGNSSIPEAMRLNAVRLIGVGPYTYEEASELLLLLPGSSAPPLVQAAAINALGRYSAPPLFTNVVSRWTALPPTLRPVVVSSLLSHAERVLGVVALLGRGTIPRAELLYQDANLLRFYPNEEVSGPAGRLLGPVPVERPEVLQAFEPVLRMRGVAENGRRVFLARCGSCHKLGMDGQEFGPDLAGVKVDGKDAILTAILEPNYQVRPGYEAWFVQTRALENYVGIVEMPHPTTLVIRRPAGQRITMSRANALVIDPQRWSPMPVGLEQGLTPQQMADLLEYLMVAPR
jgi:putative membrane-bound dehydrogenase-like protein